VTVEIALALGLARALQLAFGLAQAVLDAIVLRVFSSCFAFRALADNAQINNLGHRRTQ
jgi:hypothetical protein